MIKAGLVPAVFGLWTILASASRPTITYGTYFGGTGDTNAAVAVAIDPSGNVIMAGYTTSQTLPGTAQAFQPTKAAGFPDNRDVFIAKFDPSGRTLLWATFLGGDGDDTPTALAVDLSGNVYISGTTQSSNFPARAAISCTAAKPLQQGCSIAPTGAATSSFVAKVSSDGRTLIYSLGLLQGMTATALTVDRAGGVYIGISGAIGLYLIDLNSNGNSILLSSFLGGGGFNASETSTTSLAMDQGGNPWVAGTIATGGVSIPTTANAFQRQQSNADLTNSIGPGALNNGFVLQLNSSGSQVLYGTYFGPRYSGTSIEGLAVNSDGSLYLSGNSNATTFQATPGAYLTTASPGFVTKLTPGSSVLDAFTYLPYSRLLKSGISLKSCM